jgi:hypothetical protein
LIKLAKLLTISLLVASGAIFFSYGNFLKVSRPSYVSVDRGYIYPLLGYDGPFISTFDCLVLSMSVAGLLIGLIFVDRLYRKKT